MNRKQVNEIKNQLWDHLQYLRSRVAKLREIDIFPQEREWADIRFIGRRNGWWVLDQIYFCREEIEWWKGINSNG